MQSVKTDFSIYYVNNNVANARIIFKDKDFEAYKKEVMEKEVKIPMILSIGVNKETVPIRRDFLELAFESKLKRDPFFFISISALTLKKTMVVSLKPEATLEMIKNSEPM